MHFVENPLERRVFCLGLDPHYLKTKKGTFKLGEVSLSIVALGLLVGAHESRPARVFPMIIMLLSIIFNV